MPALIASGAGRGWAGQAAGWSGGGLVRLAGPGLEVSAVLTCGRAKAFSVSRLLAHPGASPDGRTRPLRRPPRRSRCRPRSGSHCSPRKGLDRPRSSLPELYLRLYRWASRAGGVVNPAVLARHPRAPTTTRHPWCLPVRSRSCPVVAGRAGSVVRSAPPEAAFRVFYLARGVLRRSRCGAQGPSARSEDSSSFTCCSLARREGFA